MTGWRKTGNRKRDDNIHRGFRTGLEPELLTCCGSNNKKLSLLKGPLHASSNFLPSVLNQLMKFIHSWILMKQQLVDLEFRLFCQRTAVFEPV